jgi:hypothetical protein
MFDRLKTSLSNLSVSLISLCLWVLPIACSRLGARAGNRSVFCRLVSRYVGVGGSVMVFRLARVNDAGISMFMFLQSVLDDAKDAAPDSSHKIFTCKK